MNNQSIRTLLIEDRQSDAAMLRRMISKQDNLSVHLECVGKLQAGLARLSKNDIDVVLTNLSLPDSHGLDTFNKIHNAVPSLPIIIISGFEDENLAAEAVRRGAQDYLVKERLEGRVIARVMRYAIERKRTQEVLRENEQRYRMLFENIWAGVAHLDIKGRITFASDKFCEMFETSRGDIIKRVFLRLVQPRARKDAEQIFQQAKREDSSSQRPHEIKCITKSGKEITVDLRSSALLKDGTLTGFQVMVHDVTERKHSEQERRQSAQRIQSLLDNLPDFIISVDSEGTILYINRVKPEYTLPEVIGKTIYDFYPEAEHARCRNALKQVFETGEAITIESVGLDGSLYTTRYIPIKHDGRVEIVMQIATDITEAKHAEEALQESEQRYRITIDAMHDAIHVIDKDFRILLFNQAFKQWNEELGITTDAVGKTVFELFPFLSNKVRSEYEKVFETEKALTTEERTVLNEKEFVTETRKIPISEEGQVRRVITIVRDITERKIAEEAMREAEEQYRLMAYHIPFHIGAIDASGKYIVWNKYSEKVFGYARNEVIGKLSPVDVHASKEEAQEVIAVATKEGIFDREVTLLRRDGTEFPARLIVVPKKDIDGCIIGYYGFAEDIAERKKAEEIMREQSAAMAASMDGMAILNENEEYVYLNEAHAYVYGYDSPQELIGKTWRVLYNDEERRRFEEEIMPAFFKKGRWRGEAVGRKRDGSLFSQEVSLTKLEGGGLVCVVRDITSRKKAEEVMREQSIAMAASADGISIQNERQEFIYVNDAYLRIYGYDTPDELIGKTWRMLYDEKEQKRLEEKAIPAFFENGQWRGEAVGKRRDGTVVPVEISLTKLEGVGLVGIVRDITERKQAAEAILESEQRYRSLIETAPDTIFTIDPTNGTILSLNPAFDKTSEWSRDEWIGKSFHSMIHKDDLPKVLEKIQLIVQNKTTESIEIRFYTPSGGEQYDEVVASPLIKDGKVVALIGIARDITERRQAEEEIQVLSRAVEQSPNMIIITDTNGTVQYVNQSLVTVTGYAADELIGQTLRSFCSEAIPHSEYKRLWQTITSDNIWHSEWENTTKSNDRYWCAATVYPIKNKEGETSHFLAVLVDITGRKRSEEELEDYHRHLEDLVEQRTRELRQSERLAATGRLAASIAHEINNPLQGITTHLEIIREHLPESFDKLKNYDFVKNNIDKISSIVTKLLDTFRASEEHKIKVNLNDVIGKVSALVEHQLALKKITLKLMLSRRLPDFVGWRQQLHQVILNLLLNAQDSTLPGGEITVATSLRKGHIVIEVTDTGEGIKEEDLDHIFEPFFTTKTESGTGLGLFVCQGLIQEHKGRITVKSKYGKGSMFTVSLPI